MEELGKALKAVFDKVADFFGIFDLSFFVSGITTGSALLFLMYRIRGDISIDVKENFLRVLLFIIFFYVMGLISFSIGRYLRTKVFRRRRYRYLSLAIKETAEIHKLQTNLIYKEYLDNDTTIVADIINKERSIKDLKKGWGAITNMKSIRKEKKERNILYYKLHSGQLYIRLWADLRDETGHANSYSIANRYWVMNATYDGIGTSLLTWSMILGFLTFGDKSYCNLTYVGGSVTIAFLLISYRLCLIEADRYMYNQVHEVVSTIAKKEAVKPPVVAPQANLTNFKADITIH